MFYKLTGVIVLLLLQFGCTAPPYNNINNEQLQSMLKQGIPLFDIRRPDEWKQTGIIKNSKLLTFVDGGGRVNPDFIPRFTQSINKDTQVILICRTGNRTNKLARHLVEQMGYSQVYNVRNGITQWIREGNAVNKIAF